MDLQFYGANCIGLSLKSTRIIIDDNLSAVGKKQVLKKGDVALFTSNISENYPTDLKIVIDSPGEYEVADISIVGISAKSHIDPVTEKTTMYKISTNEVTILVTGHITPELSNSMVEAIGVCDVIILPVGGHGYTLDAKGALSVIKELEPKLIIPTHYDISGFNYPVPQSALSEALKDMAIEPKETVPKLRLRKADLADMTQLVVVEPSA